MKNRYIIAELNSKNEFRITASFNVLGVSINTDVLKIDTGCGYTTFPAKKLAIFTDAELQKMKYNDIINNVKRSISYGVETGGTKHKIPKTLSEWVKCSAVSFEKDVNDFEIAGVAVSANSVRINYDRSGNLLLGMDILSQMDIHIGKSKITGKVMLIACPYSSINDEYLLALEEHFSIGTLINAAVVRNI